MVKGPAELGVRPRHLPHRALVGLEVGAELVLRLVRSHVKDLDYSV